MQRDTIAPTELYIPSPLPRQTRQLSTSTIASSAPPTPRAPNSTQPTIIDLDRLPDSPSQLETAALTSKGGTMSDEGVGEVADIKTPAVARHPRRQQLASIASEDVPEFVSSRQSNSSAEQNAPRTPDENGEEERRPRSSGYPMRAPIELFRTESAACQDELFNEKEQFVHASRRSTKSTIDPANPSAPHDQDPISVDEAQHALLSPTTRNLVNERVRIANSIRTQAPEQDVSRERSPFRQGAELAPPTSSAYSRAPQASSLLPTAASLRQQQKEQASQKELDARKPPLNRELTKTISPKDALLDAPPDADQGNSSMSLFQDVIPQGYQKHYGGSESFPNNLVSGTNQAFGQFVPMNQNNMGGFRGLDLNNWLATPVTNNNVTVGSIANANPPSSQRSEKNPEFPAQLTSMESSISDNPPASSQDSRFSPPARRPDDTSANTGTYACTQPGCTQRFDTSLKLTKHKRDTHPTTTATPSLHSSASPDDEASGGSVTPESSPDDGDSSSTNGKGMTSASLKNSAQSTGPHKCTRINPTTGKPCNTIFSRPYDLTRHEDTIHNKVKHKVRCQYCKEEKTFSRNDALTRHLRVVHPEVDVNGKRGRH